MVPWGIGVPINYIVWCALGAAIGFGMGLLAGKSLQSTLVENVLVGVFGAFVAGDLFVAFFTQAKADAGFQAAAILPAIAGAVVAMLLVGLMRRAVGPMKNSKAKPVRR